MESERDMYRQFQDWCLRTYGDSGKTKTVTRKKYERIVQLLNGSESSSTDNAKFKFWVKSKGFQLGQPDEVRGGGGCAKQVLYVPVKTTDGVGVDEKLSLRRVAVVEDFFDIIYSMHVETGPNGEQIRKHAGQKRTYKASGSIFFSDTEKCVKCSKFQIQISESYAFLPREAVTRFLMSCSECQKRMHLNPDGTDHKDNGKPPTLVTSMIDYNMPITMAYMKHMKLQLLNSQQDEDESSIESDEFDMSDSTRMSAVNSDLSSNLEERMQSPQALHGQQDDDSAAESFNGNETLGHSSIASGGTHSRDMGDSNGDGKTGLEQDEQPLNLSDSPLSAQLTSEYRIDDHSSNGKNKYKNLLISDLKMEQETRENGSKSPAHSYSSYDSGKNESVDRGAEDLSLNRGDEDEDDHDDHDDSEKVNETDGVEAERLKAFNSRPIPSHLTSAVAESILASACESESRNAAKRMRLDRQQDESAPADKQCKPEAAQATYSTSAVSGSQEVLYINGNGTYSYHSYRGLGGGLLNLNDASSSGPTDLSMKRQLATSSGSSSSSSSRPQLSPTEINAVRQLVAGYRESAAFLLRSADELENLILQQN
ncbi:nucleolar protein 4 isoform X8 [Panthera pardus]|uniref:Nucleolar protein 4 isoform X8 n=2 Tax=Panthera TaxID=9688 RepID=A0A9W2VJM0_PANPR|nr:nucleolar protein 4 isoform X8 [Puma yagouaroundi]XP_042766953.1 nucleolar protein 4 isoform X7 [Panthera leo]XP_042818643.1 nucleolar protein 4 isoform X7 [Panthera tigris]XP_043414501.1 nucleolar protein 4 isoform X5 [Prionailurus bengalensis]XP_044897993.1 nucleolar protein 4 isoform X9 [Felis catus]XP_045313164.1 nucleolar protein 4 isoform X8 [Leopardus geoffroyi]XP_046943009.1 nucleolar protein 4 isoform X2 [Lynx rufus]XP_049476193.1 nucleolar protein 4 isoform X7 [Panthera uncia]X